MNNSGWNGTEQPSAPAGDQQSATGGQQQPDGAQQFQQGGQQQFTTGAQQQVPFAGQPQLPTGGQQFPSGQFVAGGQQQPHSMQAYQPQGGQHLSNDPGARQSAGGQFAAGGAETQQSRYPSSGHQPIASDFPLDYVPQPSAVAQQPPPQLSISIPPSYQPGGQVQQRDLSGKSQQSLSPAFPPGPARLPPGLTLRQGSGNGPLVTPVSARCPSGPQQQQSRQFTENNQQFPAAVAPQFQYGVQDQRQFSGSPQQLSPVPPQFQPDYHQQQQIPGNGYVISPGAAQNQPGSQQHFTSGMLNAGVTQFASMQTSAYVQPLSANAPKFQPGVQQHIISGQSSPAGTSFPGDQHFLHGQPFHDAQQSGLQYPTGQPQVQAYVENYSEDEYQYDWNADAQGYENENELDVQGDQEMAGTISQDPLYHHTLEQVEMWKAQANRTMTDEEKANFAAYATWKRNNGTNMNNKRVANLGDCHFDEREMDDAVRASKRQRRDIAESREFYKHAQKVYAYGPPNNPDIESVDEDDNAGLEGLDLDAHILGLSADFKGGVTGEIINLSQYKPAPPHQALDPNFRLIESITSNFWLMTEITKHMTVNELIMLYSVSRTFHNVVNSRFMSTMAAWAQHKSPAGWKVFYWKFYGKYTHLDPGQQPWLTSAPWTFPRPPWAEKPDTVANRNDVRHVPGFRYLEMLVRRERRTRDILACLARSGHRLPAAMHLTLKKIWMLMDMSTCNLRRSFIHNTELWTDQDLYNAQMFFVKLNLRFNEPVFGPNSTILADTFLGAREGLTALWELLRSKKYHHPNEIIRRRVKYWVPESFKAHYEVIGRPYFDVSPWDLGQEHLEGWGAGNIHLRRPDELVVEECVRRRIDMEAHLVFMVFWGHVDWKRRVNLVPTEEEMYMSDDELPPLPRKGKFAPRGIYGRCGNVPFHYDNWQPKHAMKARWATLTRSEKLAIVEDDKEEQLRGTVFEETNDEFWMPYNVNDITPPKPEEVGSRGEDESQQYAYQDEDEAMDWEEDDWVEDEDEEVDDDAASVESFFQQEQPIPGGDFTVTYPLWPKIEKDDNNRPTITQIEYQYVEDEPLQIPDGLDPDEDAQTIREWDNMDPFLQRMVIDRQTRDRKQGEKDDRTLEEDAKATAAREEEAAARMPKYSPTTLRNISAQWQQPEGDNGESSSARPDTPEFPYHYEYPGVNDPDLLEMLRQYDRFAPEAFHCDEDGNHMPAKEVERAGNNNANPLPPKEAEDARGGDDADAGSEADDDADSDSDFDDMDDEALKALADVDYDEEELDFDVNRYKNFLARIGTEGESKDRSKKKADKRGKGKATAGDSSDDVDMERMAHEKDLDDDDIPFPEYEFRRY